MSFGNILSVQDIKKLFSKFIHGIQEFWLQLWMIFIYFKENLKIQHILICFIVTEVDPGTFNDREGGGVGGPNFHPCLQLTCFLVNFVTGKFAYASD